MPRGVVLRHPARRWAAAVLLPILVLLAVALPGMTEVSPAWRIALIVVVLVGLVACVRVVFVMGVRATERSLVIRGVLWTRHIRWGDIDDFVVRTTGNRRGVFVVCPDGRQIGLDAAMPPYQLGNRAAYFEECRVQLRSWLDESRRNGDRS
jgi:hypothetical protein